MKIKTNSFELALYIKGDQNSNKLALVLPGKFDTKDYPHMKNHVDFLADNGYLAISFDPPGTWESSDDISLYTMTNYIKTVNEVIEYFNNKQTILIGHSMGGSITMFTAMNNPNVIGFIAIMSPYKFELTKVESSKSIRDIPGDSNTKKTFNVPKTFFEDISKYNATEGLSKLTKPKLFIYGKNDITINPKIVKEAFELSAEPKEIIEVNSDHDYRYNPETIKEVNHIIKNWLDENFIPS